MNDVWLFLNQNSDTIFAGAMFVLGLFSPSAARRIRRMIGSGDKILK